jgi:uncharacterized protein YecT (DUF1311 family)
MKTTTLLVLSIVALFVSLTASAQQRKPDPCEKANESGVTVDLVECSQKKLSEADADLNKVYRQLMSKLGDKKWELKLRTAQQAWIKYRDANCDYVSEFSGGGSATTFEYNFCLADMTTARAKELLEMLNQIKERAGQ